MNAYEKLQTARSQTRPTARSYIEKLFQERTELHGDRKYADDAAIIGGIGMLGDIPATFIGIERGRNLEERIRCNFGCPMPEGGVYQYESQAAYLRKWKLHGGFLTTQYHFDVLQ